MSGPAGSSGTGTGSTANVYTPKNQGAFDTSFTSILNDLISGGGSPGATVGNPASTFYQPATDTANQYLFPNFGGYAGTSATTATTGATTGASDYLTGTYPTLTGAVAPLGSYGATGLSQAATLPGYQQQIADAAFDPQKALYNKDRASVMDYANVANSMSGTSSSPYGSSVTSKALSDFDIDWNKAQLSNIGQGVTDIGNLATGYGTYGKAGESGYTTAGNIGYGAAQGLDTTSYAPYYTGSQIGDTALKGYANLTDLGTSAYKLPQQSLQDIESYLNLGQSASTISGSLGNLGFGQTASGIGGALSGANSLFGTNSLIGGSSGVFGSGGLFGSGASSASDGLAAGGDFGGGGDIASTILPAAAS